jgi:hypothetical protein
MEIVTRCDHQPKPDLIVMELKPKNLFLLTLPSIMFTTIYQSNLIESFFVTTKSSNIAFPNGSTASQLKPHNAFVYARTELIY